MTSIYLVTAKRTAIGSFGGSLRDAEPATLAAHVTKAALTEANIAPALVGQVMFGQVIPTAPRDAYVARVAMIEAGIPRKRRP